MSRLPKQESNTTLLQILSMMVTWIIKIIKMLMHVAGYLWEVSVQLIFAGD